MADFSGKNTLITGGSRGIGKAIALEFARRGSNIIFNYLCGQKLMAKVSNKQFRD